MTAAGLAIAAFSLMAIPPALRDLVEPADLAKRPELLNREVAVDDRVRYFLKSNPKGGYDELMLKRTEVLFRLPPKFRQPRAPGEPNARVRGLLHVVEGRLVCDVESLEMMPADLDRLDRELPLVRPADLEGRQAWAAWAERRGRELADPKLEARGAAIEAEVLDAEADRPGADIVALAERSRARPIAPAARDGLFHRGFRAALKAAPDADAVETLAKRIEAALPGSRQPDPSPASDAGLLDAYRGDPSGAYRAADEPTRRSLDRRLLLDAIGEGLERRLAAKPADAMALADQAAARMPDRPEVAGRLRQAGLGRSEADVASLRQSEVEDLARTFREQDQDDRARRLLRNWLDARRRGRLSASDSEGRILLAASYDRLLGDKIVAADLLREALTIEPDSRAAADAFLRMGYRKGDSGWYDPRGQGGGTPGSTAAGGATAQSDPLAGLTRAQVRSRLGSKPDRIARSVSQGRCLEQWAYRSGKATQVINFAIEPGTVEPRVTSHYLDQP